MWVADVTQLIDYRRPHHGLAPMDGDEGRPPRYLGINYKTVDPNYLYGYT